MDKQTLLQEALKFAQDLLGLPSGGLCWELEEDSLTFQHTEQALQPLMQQTLEEQLPTLIEADYGPCIIQSEDLNLQVAWQFLLLPLQEPHALNEDSSRVGLLLFLPQNVELSEGQWSALHSLVGITTPALRGLTALQDAYRRQERLKAVATVGRDATVFLNPDELLHKVAQLISAQLGFYHVGIFIVDEEQNYAVMQATNSPEGQQLLAIEHRLKVGEQGMVGYVTGTGDPRIALDVGSDATHFANPFLPRTRSEITLPMRHRGQVIGALDVQSTEANAFTQEDFTTLQIMADQLGNALINARLYKALRRRLRDTHLLRQVMLQASALSREGILQETLNLLGAELSFPYQVFLHREGEQLLPLEGCTWPAASHTVTESPWREIWAGESYWLSSNTPQAWASATVQTLAAVPVRSNGEALYIFAVASPQAEPGRHLELRFLEALAAELSILLENARLYEASVRSVELLRRLTYAGEQMTAALSVPTILDILAETILSEINGAVEIGLLVNGTRLEWVKRASNPEAQPECIFASFTHDTDLEVLEHHLEHGAIILPEEHTALSAQAPEMAPFLACLPPHPFLLQPLQTKERAVGVLALSLSDPQQEKLEEQIAWVQALANHAALALNNAQLIERLSKQTRELTAAYEEANRLNEIRTQMIQNVSHELRTPLSLILGYTEMLMEGAIGSLEAQQTDVLRTIHSRARSLHRMIQSLTTLQDILPLHQITPVPAQDLIHAAIQEFQELANRDKIRFYVEIMPEMPPIPGDAERLGLVLNHLLENAIKFSPQGGSILVRSWAEPPWAYLSVTDKGIGIAKEHHQFIFERFYQVDGSSKRRFGGMGIGLALVMEIVEAHQGEINVESEPGQGSTFTVKLPLQREITTEANTDL